MYIYVCVENVFVKKKDGLVVQKIIMVEHGKDKALDHIPKSSIAFIAKITDVQRAFSSVTYPPQDHYKLQFDHKDLRTLRGRVYDTMINFEYSQVNCPLVFSILSIFFSHSLEKVFFLLVMTSIMGFVKFKRKFQLLGICTLFV